MARRLNKPAVAIMTLALMFVLMVAGVFIVQALRSPDAGPRVQMAEEALAQGEYEKAVAFYHQAFQRSKDTQYLIEAAKAAREMGEAGMVFQLLEAATVQKPEDLEPRRMSLSLWLDILEMDGWRVSGQTATDIIRDAEALLKHVPDEYVALLARGAALLHQPTARPEQRAQGLTDLEAVLAQKPLDERALTVLWQYWVREREPEKAEALFAKAIETNPDEPVGYLLMGRLRLSLGRHDEAVSDLQKAVDLSKDSTEALVSLAQAYRLQKQLAKAEEMLDRALQIDPADFGAYLELTQVRSGQARLEDALAAAKEWLAKPPLRTGYRAIAYRNQRTRMLVQAGTLCVTLAASQEEGDARDQLLQQTEQYVTQAEQETGRPIASTHMLRGHVLWLRGHAVDAVKSLETADSEFGGTNVQVKLSLAELYVQQREWGAAQRMLNEAIQLAPGYAPAYRMLAKVKASLGDSAAAEIALDQCLKIAPDDREAIQLKIAMLHARGRADEARMWEEKIGKPESVEDRLRLAAQRLAQGEVDEGLTLYREILAEDPANARAVRTIVAVLLQDDQVDEARQIYEKAIAVAPQDRRLREIEVLFASPDQRAAMMLEFIQSEPDEWTRYMQLFSYHVSQRNYDEAGKAADALAALKPEDERVVHMQFSLALHRKDWAKAEQYVSMAARLGLDGADGRFFRARLAMAQGQWEKARDDLNLALRQYPTNSDGWVWLGQALASLQQYDAAKQQLRRALELNPRKGEAYKGLAQIAMLQEDTAAFEENLQQAVRYLPRDGWVVGQAVALMERRNPQQAIQNREQLLQQDPDNLENLTRLAELYEQEDRLDDAARMHERAVQLAPKEARVAWLAASYWQRRGDPARAERIMLDAVQAADDPAQANLLLGQLYQEQNEVLKAEQAMLVAGKQSQAWPVRVQVAEFYRAVGQTDKALEWYRQALKGEGLQLADEARVRQRLVEVLLQTRLLDEAAKEIDAYRTAIPNDSKYELMRGTLLMLQGHAQQAVEELTRFLDRQPNNAAGHYHRGLLYLAMADRLPQAISDLVRARELDPTGFNYQHRVALASAYEKSGDVDRAVTEMRSILEAQPQSPEAVRALAALLQRTRRDRELETLVRGYMGRDPGNWRWPRLLGELGELRGDIERAVEGYSRAAELSGQASALVDDLLRIWNQAQRYDQTIQYVTQLPQEKRSLAVQGRLAEALCRSGRQDEGTALFEAALAGAGENFGGAITVIRCAVAALGADEAQAMLDRRLAAKPDDLVAKYLLVSLLAEREQFEPVERLSAELLAAAPNDEYRKLFLRLRGSVLYKAGKYETAVKAYEDVLKLAPRDPDGLNNAAYIYAEHLNRPAEAEPYARLAVNLRPQDGNMLDTLGWVYYLKDDLDNAMGTFLRAVQVAPSNPAIRYHMAMVYKRKGQADLARRELEEAARIMQASPEDPLVPQFQDRVTRELKELKADTALTEGAPQLDR